MNIKCESKQFHFSSKEWRPSDKKKLAFPPKIHGDEAFLYLLKGEECINAKNSTSFIFISINVTIVANATHEFFF